MHSRQTWLVLFCKKVGCWNSEILILFKPMCWLQAIQWKSELSLAETFLARLWGKAGNEAESFHCNRASCMLDPGLLQMMKNLHHTELRNRDGTAHRANPEMKFWMWWWQFRKKNMGWIQTQRIWGCGRRVSRMWCIQVLPEDHHLQRKAQKRWWSQQLCDTTTQVGFCTWLPHHAVAEDGLSILPPSHALPGSWSFLLQSPALAPKLHMVYLK